MKRKDAARSIPALAWTHSLVALALLAGGCGARATEPEDAAIPSPSIDAGPLDATPPTPRLLHYTTDFRSGALMVKEGGAYRSVPLEIESASRAVARGFAPAGVEVSFHVRNLADGREDHPPGGGDYWLPADLGESWLDKGVLYDVDPATLNIDLIDAHTHPYQRVGMTSTFTFDPGSLLAIEKPFGVDLIFSSYNDTLDVQRTRMLALQSDNSWIRPLVWITPQRDQAAAVAALLDAGFLGMKFHPARSAYPADGALLDPFLDLCAARHVPIQIHSSATDDNASVARIIALATRHPDAAVVMIHTDLGQIDKTSTLAMVAPHSNIYVETSWTNGESICQAMNMLGGARMLFGTDATTDGMQHFTNRSIANPAGQYVYSYGDVMAKVRSCASPGALENWASLTALRLFRPRFARRP